MHLFDPIYFDSFDFDYEVFFRWDLSFVLQSGKRSLDFYHISDLILFFGLYKVLIGISLGLPRAHYMVIATLLSGVAKYLLNVALIGSLEYRGAIYATEIATGICILASYYVLKKEGIRLFVANLKSCLKGILYGVFSLLIVIFVRLFFSLRHYAQYYQILLYALLFRPLRAFYVFRLPPKQRTKRLILHRIVIGCYKWVRN